MDNPTDHVQIVGFLAAGMIMTTSSVNALVYQNDGAREAAAAGFILLSMVEVGISCIPNNVKKELCH